MSNKTRLGPRSQAPEIHVTPPPKKNAKNACPRFLDSNFQKTSWTRCGVQFSRNLFTGPGLKLKLGPQHKKVTEIPLAQYRTPSIYKWRVLCSNCPLEFTSAHNYTTPCRPMPLPPRPHQFSFVSLLGSHLQQQQPHSSQHKPQQVQQVMLKYFFLLQYWQN